MINSINVLADSPDDSAVEVNVADEILRTHFGLSDSAIAIEGLTKNYLVTYSAVTGNLKFAGENLYYAVHSEGSERSYNMLSDEDLWCDLGTMEGAGSTLTINGGGFDINGYDSVNHYSGITVQSGQTLNVNNVGAWKDMSGEDGSVLNNSGTLNITNTNFKDNTSTSKGLIYNTGDSANMTITDSSFTNNTGRAIYNNNKAHITNMSDVTIKGGGFSTAEESGGAICNYGKIDLIEDVVIRDTTSKVGSAIYNVGNIGTVRNVTISNSISADNIFGNQGRAKIDLIDNLTMENSSAAGLSFYGAFATTIQNSTFTGMYGTQEKTGFGLQVTSVQNGTASIVDLIDNVVVSSNQKGGMRIDDNGSAQKSYVGLIKNSQFTDNGGTGSNKAGGIWAKTNTLTISADGEGEKTVFKGNKRQGASVGIWMDNKNSTLNLQQLNNGEMYMYDRINGTTDRYYVNISGDNTGTLYLYDDIVNGMVDVQDTKLSTVDGVVHSYTFSTLKSDEDSKYFLDINFRTDNLPASTIDNFTITNSSLNPETGVTKETTGRITLKALNFINDVQTMKKGDNATLQVLHSPTDNLQLEKGFDKEGDFDVLFVLQDDTKQEVEQIAPVTPWHDDIAIYSVKTKILGQANLLTTNTTNDTLQIIIESALQDKVQIGSMDTLAAVNQANLANRTYSTNVENDVFNVSMNMGATEGGNFTILGADPVNRSVIDFGETEHYKGFELDSPTILTLKNVEIKNSSQLVSGIATNATIRAYDSYLHDNGEGIYTAGNMNVEGTTQINDNIHLMGDNSALTVTGKIGTEPVEANVTFNVEVGGSGTSTFTFGAGTVNLGNQASVSDTNLVLSNTTLNVGANDAFSGVKLTGGNSTLNLKNESVGVQNFDSLTLNSDINIGLDVDLANSSTDKITVAAGDVVTPNAHNIIINSIYLMTDASSATTNIILTEDNRFKNVYKLSNDILANVTRAASVSGSYTINYADFATEVDPNKGILIFNRDDSDTLATIIAKDMGEAAIKAYLLPEAGETVEADLGTLNGAKLVINGNGQTDTNFIKGGNAHTGVVLGNGKTQTLEVNNVKEWSGFTDSAIKNKSGGTVKILNTNFSGNTVSDIDNSGVLEFSGTNTLVKVNDSAATANGTIEIKDGATSIANVQQKSVTVTNGKLVVSNNLTTTSGVINNIVNGLKITGGTINSDISGTFGATEINSAGNVSLTDGKTITQAINLTSGTFTTNAAGIKGGLTNSGTVNLTGGTLDTTITGGNITISGNVSSDITKLDGTITNNVTFNMTGNLSKDIDGTGTTVLQSTTATVTDGTEIEGTLNVNNKTIGMNNSAYDTLTVGKLTGNGNLELDVNATTNESDIININGTSENNSLLTITTLNFTKPEIPGLIGSYSKQIITGNTTGATLKLSDDLAIPVITPLHDSGTNELNTNSISWNENYGGWTQDGTKTETFSIESSNTLKYQMTKVWGEKQYNTKQENLAIMNTYTGTGSNNRSVSFNGIWAASPTPGTYTVNANLGTSSAGTYTLNGVKGGASETTNTTVDLNNHSGFVLENQTNLVLNNIDLKDSTNPNATVITVSNNNADITLTNTNVQGAISRTGSVTYDIIADETNSLQNVTGARIANNGNLSLSGTNNLVNITDADGSTTITGGTTTSGAITQSAVTISGGNLIATDGITTTNGITNNVENGLEVQGGTINSNISGASGSTKINGNVSLTDGKTITQAINLTSGTFTTNAAGIKGGLTNSGTVNLTGGTLDTTITGGNITISGDVTSNASNLAGAIVNESSTLTLTGGAISGAISGAGTTIIGTGATVTNASASNTIANAVTLNSGSKLTTVADAIANNITGVTTPETTPIVELNGGALGNYTISNAKIVIADDVTANATNLAGTEINNATEGNILTLNGGDIKAEIKGSGTTAITAAVTNTGNNNLNNVITVANVGTLTTGAGTLKNTVTNSGTVNLTGGELETTITGGGATTINGDVTVGAGGSIANAVSFDGTGKQLTAALSQLTGGITVSDNNTLNLQGQIADGISGTGTVKLNEQQNITSNISYGGTLDLNGNTINMNDSSYETLTVGKLTGTGNLTINADASTTTGSSDTINITGTGSDSVLTITALNMTTPTSVADEGYTYQKEILTGTPGSATITLIDAVISQYASSTDISKTGTDDLHTNNIKWDSNYGEWTEYGTQTTGVSVADGTKLQYQVTKTYDESTKTYTGKAENLAIMNTYDETGSDNRIVDFTGILNDPTAQGNYTVTSDLGATGDGNFTIKGETDGEKRAVIDFNTHSGFELNSNNTTVTLKDVEVKGANATQGLVSGIADTNVNVVLDNVNLHDNGSGIKTAGNVEIKGNSTIADKIQVNGASSKIDVDGTNEVTLNGNLVGTGTTALNVSNGTFNIGNNANISAIDVKLTDTNLNLASENSLNGLNVTINGTNNLSMANNSVGILSLGNINLNSVLTMQIDADLANQKMDKLTATSATVGAGGAIQVDKINLLSPTTEQQLDLLFTNNETLANAVSYTGDGTIVYSPIYQYTTSYIKKDDGGYFRFATPGGGTPSDFNPAVIASPIAAQAGVMATMNNTFNYAFNNADSFTKLPAQERFLSMNANRYAINEPETKGFASTDFDENLNIDKMYKDNSAIWFRPYTVFENIPLANGPKVEAISYGTLVGFDTDFQHLKNGWNSVISGYIGYNGAQLSYSGVSSSLNGGLLGATQTFYKKNFWTAVTATTGASVADTNTMYGHEDSTSLFAGIGSKTGYNFEFNSGKFIVQPIWFMSYSFINTFDYTNAAGVRINSKPLHTIQLNPSIRFIGNIKNWQPYAFVGMVWNLMDRTDATANGVRLPEMHIRPYVQYGVGIQKSVGEHFTGFAQATIHNGGRNGIALTGGFRWALGKSSKDKETVKNKNIILIQDKKSGNTDKSSSPKGEKHVIKELNK